MSKNEPLLKHPFVINNSTHSVWLFKHQLTWCPLQSGEEDMSEWMNVKISEIFSIEIENVTKGGSMCCFPASVSSPCTHNLVIYYARRKINSNVWECEAVKFGHMDLEILTNWSTAINSTLNDLKHRPKNLLVFMNPFGGKRRSKIIFENCVKPIFELGRVTWTLIETEYGDHATETLISMSQDRILEYDVVVAIGGDGTACEIVTGLLKRGADTSASNQDTLLQPAPLNIAVIPGGSSNALAYSVHGTDDPSTAAIHLVLGGSVPLDVGVIHNQTGVEKFFVTQMSYGHLADTLKKSENLRWMGPRRYDYAGLCKFLNHKTYEGTVHFRIASDDTNKQPSICGAGEICDDCVHEDSSKELVHSEWKKVEGKFIGISAANISCRCALCPQGMAPFAHLSDGYLDLIIVKRASRLNHLKYLLRTAGDSRSAFQLPFVERYHVKEFTYTPVKCCPAKDEFSENGGMGSYSSVESCGCECDARQSKKKHSVWNCDGELLMQPNVRVSVHHNLIRIMAHAPVKNQANKFSNQFEFGMSTNLEQLPMDVPIN